MLNKLLPFNSPLMKLRPLGKAIVGIFKLTDFHASNLPNSNCASICKSMFMKSTKLTEHINYHSTAQSPQTCVGLPGNSVITIMSYISLVSFTNFLGLAQQCKRHILLPLLLLLLVVIYYLPIRETSFELNSIFQREEIAQN